VKILVVDDVIQNIQVIGSLLMEHHYQVVFALSGAEALNLIEKTYFDLILLDVLMPPPDGIEVCNLIKSKPATKDIPIIFLTAKSDLESIIKGFDAGAQDYLSKPFKSEELLVRVKTQVLLKKQREQLESLNELLEEKVNKRTNELTQVNRRLVSLENTKNDFLLQLSRELRSPLNVMNGFVEILESTLTSDEQIQSLNYLKTSATKLTNLAETALLLGEIQLGTYSLNFEKISLKEISKKVCKEIEAQTDHQSLKIEMHTFCDNDEISGDIQLIYEVVKRVIEDVVRTSSINSSIQISIQQNESSLNFSIIGIGTDNSKEDRSGYFGIGDKTQAYLSQSGYGLSMAVARLIMEIHSGTFTVENKSGGCNKVTLSFPA
jgi:two-component system sensor histidine kinase/response regulator